MNVLASIELLIGLFAGLVVAMIILIFLQVRSSANVQRLAAPVYDYVIQEADAKAQKIIEDAKKSAQKIEADAEKKKDALVAEYTAQISNLHKTFEKQLAVHSKKLEKTIDDTFADSVHIWQEASNEMKKQVTDAEKSVVGSFMSLTASLETAETTITERSATVVDEFGEKVSEVTVTLKEKLADYDSAITTQIDTHTAEALKVIDNSLAAYRRSREKILDMHMAQIIENVASDVLHKQMTLQDHSDLVKQALIEAKRRQLL
jgi:hypothetical protein